MNDEQIRAALRRHWSDIEDQETVHEIYREDMTLEFPQSGERIVGRANVRAMREAYPASVGFAIERMRGTGDLWVTEGRITYDGAKTMRTVTIMEFQDGQVIHETIYFNDPWDPPAWRAPWVEPTG